MDITEAHARLLRDQSIQFQLSGQAPTMRPVRLPSLPPFALGNGSWLFWIVLSAMLLAIAVVAGRAALARRRAVAAGRSAADPMPAHVAVPASALPEADGLAAMGRFGEAVHVLLLQGVAAIEERFPRALSPSHTSREIVGLAPLPEAARTAFAGIADRVERAIFASRELSREDWETCRVLYAGLTALPRP